MDKASGHILQRHNNDIHKQAFGQLCQISPKTYLCHIHDPHIYHIPHLPLNGL